MYVHVRYVKSKNRINKKTTENIIIDNQNEEKKPHTNYYR